MTLCGKFDGGFCVAQRDHGGNAHFIRDSIGGTIAVNEVTNDDDEMVTLSMISNAPIESECGYYITTEHEKQFTKGDDLGIRDGHLYVYEHGAIVYMVGLTMVKTVQHVT
jgi:hypothetical protein